MAEYTSPASLQGHVYHPDLLSESPSDASAPSPTLSVALSALTEKLSSGELSIDELLQRIAAQSCLMTGATGAALALRRAQDGAVICCASSGAAPPVGSHINARFGISGECLRSGRLLSCKDTENDPRVDTFACRNLGVRSIVVLPLYNDDATVGILEVFSDNPAAFAEEHINSLQSLAYFARAATATIPSQPAPAENLPTTEPQPASETRTPPAPSSSLAPEEEPLPFAPDESPGWLAGLSSRLHWTIATSIASVVLLSLSALSVFLWMWQHRDNVEASPVTPTSQVRETSAATQSPSLQPTALMTVSASARSKPSAGLRPLTQKAASIIKVLSPAKASEDPVGNPDSPKVAPPPESSSEDIPPPSVLALNAQPPSVIRGVLAAPASIPRMNRPVSEGITAGRLEHQVSPVYPQQARQMRVEGPVTLRAVVGEDGKVRDIRVIKGDPILAKAAQEAVRQWRYKPYELNHRPVAMTTDITIDFKLQ